MFVRPMTSDDAAAVAKIYQEGIDTGDASFETAAPSWEDFDTSHLTDHRFVAAEDADPAQILGWVAVAPTSMRPVYSGVVEHSVYVSPAARGKGAGDALMRALIDSTETGEVWTIQAGVFPENAASLALHAKHGFRVLGVSQRVGRTAAGLWRDVVRLERRSAVAGVD